MPPHLVFSLVDDLGHSLAGFTRAAADAAPPHILELARSGLVLDRYYASSMCAPSREAFLSGRLPHHSEHMEDWSSPEDVAREDQANGLLPAAASNAQRSAIPDDLFDLRWTLLPRKLKQAGYACHAIGKWHPGGRPARSWLSMRHLPTRAGFDSFYGFMGKAGSHFAITTAHSHFDPVPRWEGERLSAADDRHEYSTRAFGERALELLRVHKSMAHNGSAPLFLYLAWQVAAARLRVTKEGSRLHGMSLSVSMLRPNHTC